MKHRYLAIFLILSVVGTAAYAGDKKDDKGGKNYFIGAGLGAMTVFNDGMNSPTLNIYIQGGKYITPTWGVRGALSGIWQSLEEQSTGYSKYCKKFGELNLDAMLNLNSLFGNKNIERAVDVYLFAGPTLSISSAVSGTISYSATESVSSSSSSTSAVSSESTSSSGTTTSTTGSTSTITYSPSYGYEYGDAKLRVGATVGLGLGFNINTKWAITAEARLAVTPSIFGQMSDCRKAEATGRLNIGFIYTIGGKNFKTSPDIDIDALNDEINRCREAMNKAQQDAAAARNAAANAKPEVREVVKEKPVTAFAVFFKIGRSEVSSEGKVQIQLAAKLMKQNPDKKYKVSGYADKATGSAATNQKLTDKRAKAVYDALVAEGVSESQLEIVSNGGTDNMFGSNELNRVVITE